MASFKEIVTKAVIGKAKKKSVSKFVVKPGEVPDTVLGCWVINHTFEGRGVNGVVEIHGGFDVNVWYSYNNDTKTAVATEHFTYEDRMNIKLKDGAVLNDASEIIVRSLKNTTVTKAEVKDGTIIYTVEKELGVEIVGDTKVKISIEEGEDPWEEIGPDINTEIDQSVNEDYLNEKESD